MVVVKENPIDPTLTKNRLYAMIVQNAVTNLMAARLHPTTSIVSDGLEIYGRNHTIIVEEVDRNGNSALKMLELPDYDIGQELPDERRRKSDSEGEKDSKVRLSQRDANGGKEEEEDDLYGCRRKDENRRRKCLQRRKKLIRKKYRNWRGLIRRIIKDIDKKIKSSRVNCTRSQTLNFSTEFSADSLRRGKP
ncbi:hypothetical protein RUM44_004761 [Polyplax serrata]|uniref:Uncharacterized protein n=1 Tax=Polyplax serrata TaxID=468196 RepID=A0ABR1B484_POLSC